MMDDLGVGHFYLQYCRRRRAHGVHGLELCHGIKSTCLSSLSYSYTKENRKLSLSTLDFVYDE